MSVKEACSDAVLVLDVDFVPSRGLHDTLFAFPGGLNAFLRPDGTSRALVIPAFESSQPDLPHDFAGLDACGDSLSPSHVAHFDKGHRATDYPKWMQLAAMSSAASTSGSLRHAYSVCYEDFYEPYVVISASRAPRF